jgi:sulfate adenylyltransferase subunit 1 (EFTu-like GTPase family)
MDIVGYEKEVYDKFANRLTSFPVIPISALRGDNVLKLSQNMPWYQGHTVESLLHRFQPMHSVNKNIFFPVQYSFGNDVLGTLKTGVITVGSELKDSLNNQICKVQKIFRGLDEVPKGAGGEALRLVLTRSYERGDVLVSENTQKPPYFSFAIEWCQLAPGNQDLVMRYNTSEVIVSSLSAHEELELETGQWKKISGDIQINNIYRGIFRLQSSITFCNEEAALFDLKSGATVAAVLLKKGEE